MHHLIPSYIIDKLQQGESSGSFPCAALFVDISGFTGVTETLMEHGQYGAEILAVVMRTVFSPLIHSVYEQGGFITGFAGDAFTAVFPEGIDQVPAHTHALAAAWQIQQHMSANNRQQTRFGVFDFSAKIGLALGESVWGIISSNDGKRATYYFSGSAINGCAQAEAYGTAGDIIADNAFYKAAQGRIAANAVDEYWRLEHIMGEIHSPGPVAVPPINIDLASRFVPRALLERETEGEFRQILNLFIGLQGIPTREELDVFMQDVFRLQSQYGGFLNRIDFGDKGCHLLLFWGAPLSHEQDLAHVLDFILALEGTGKIPLRAGITYRIAHAGMIGSELAEEYTCYGRGVNLAARYMTSASWGEIWLDGETAQRASTEFEVEPSGLKTFKGFVEEQEVYQLKRRRIKHVSHFEGKPMIGRQQELEVLREAIQPIFEGRFAGSVAIIGEAGVGKSHLVDALYETYLEKAAAFFCQTDELLHQSLNPFRYFLTRYFNYSPLDSDDANKRRFSHKLEDLIHVISDPVLGEELRRAYSFLGNLIGLSWEDSLYEQLDPELRFENTLDGLKAFFKAESLRRPLIIHLEDAHWLDGDSQTFLTRLTHNVQDIPFVLLITSRDDLPETLFETAIPKTEIQLQSLDQESIAELGEYIIGQAPSSALVTLLRARTQGNPFFVEQILLYLQEHGLLETIGAESSRTLPGDAYIPTDVRAVLTARLDRLPYEIKDLIQKAAVLGREFEIAVLAAMVDSEIDLASCLATGSAEKIWLNSGPESYVFRHALLRDAAYEMQLGARLRQLHNQAAMTYERVYPNPGRAPHFAEIAYHYDCAEEAKQAQYYYGAAGGYAKGAYSNEDAIAYFGRALELTDASDFETQYAFLSERENIFQWLGNREQQYSDLEQLEKVVENQADDTKRADLALRQSSFALVTGNYDEALEKVGLALEYAKLINDSQAEARAYHRHGRTLWEQGRGLEAKEVLNQALNAARAAGNLQLEAESLYDLAMAYRMQAQFEHSLSVLKQALGAYESLADEQGIVRCYNLFGVIDYEMGNILESEQYYLRALDLCHSIGWRFAETHILFNIATTRFEFGDYDQSESYLKDALTLSAETGNQQLQAMSLDTMGLIAYYQGDPKTAITLYERAETILGLLDQKRDLGFVLTHYGYATIVLGDLDKAEIILNQALEFRRELGAAALAIDAMAGLAWIAKDKGRVEDAREITSEILSYIAENSTSGIELPIQVYLICYQVLTEVAKLYPPIHAQAIEVLEAGHLLLNKRVEQLPDQDMQRRFLQNVPYNRDLQAAWAAENSSSSTHLD